MIVPDTLFKKAYPFYDAMYNCLPAESANDAIKKVEIETYSIRAEEFDEQKMLQLPEAEHASLQPLRQLPKGAVIAELGCGDGRFGFQLLREGYSVIQSDIAVGSVQMVKEVAEKHGLTNGTYAVIDAEDLPFKDSSLEAILMVATFHHLPHIDRALKEFVRVLKPGGMVVLLREPASWQYKIFGSLYTILRKILRNRNKNPISHADDETHGFSRRSIRQLLTPYFTDITLVPVQYIEKYYLNYVTLKSKFSGKKYQPHYGLARVLQKIDRGIARISVLKNTTWDWDIVARKRK